MTVKEIKIAIEAINDTIVTRGLLKAELISILEDIQEVKPLTLVEKLRAVSQSNESEKKELISLEALVSGIETQTSDNKRYANEYYIGDYEILDGFDKADYNEIILTDASFNDTQDKLTEKAVCFDIDTVYLVTITTNIYNGEESKGYIRQELTLKGVNRETKNINLDENSIEIIDGYYNRVLKDHGYGYTIADVRQLADFNPEFNCYILSFKTDDGTQHWLTVNSSNQLTKITKRDGGRSAIGRKLTSSFS